MGLRPQTLGISIASAYRYAATPVVTADSDWHGMQGGRLSSINPHGACSAPSEKIGRIPSLKSPSPRVGEGLGRGLNITRLLCSARSRSF